MSTNTTNKTGTDKRKPGTSPFQTTINDLEEVQLLFSYAWEHTTYRANLVALRSALGLNELIDLPVEEEVTAALERLDRGRPLCE